MKPSVHLAASAVVSASLFAVTKSPTIAGVSFLCGFLIDIDHFIDYFREYGFRINRKDFFRVFNETRFEKLWLVFHAWEWVFALFLLAIMSGWNEVVLGLLIGVVHHMVLDQIGNGVTAGGYFIVYRAINRFVVKSVVPEDALRRQRKQTDGDDPV
jgi:hypothetical protein